MSEATAALLVAILGAATGLVALVWNVLSWQRQGPNIKLDAYFSSEVDAIAALVWNAGRGDAHISTFGFDWFELDAEGREVQNFTGVPHKHVAVSRVDGSLTPAGTYDGRVPANGLVRVVITIPDDESLLGILRGGGKVFLMAQCGPRKVVSDRVQYR